MNWSISTEESSEIIISDLLGMLNNLENVSMKWIRPHEHFVCFGGNLNQLRVVVVNGPLHSPISPVYRVHVKIV
jgi:hypothetical protein